MKKLASAKEFTQLSEEFKKKLAERESKVQVKVHMGTCGISSGAKEIFDVFSNEIEARNLKNIVLLKVGCIGLCGVEPMVTVVNPNKLKFVYVNLNKERALKIVEDHLVKGEPVPELAIDQNLPLFKLQERRVLADQEVDAGNIEDYIASGGYHALTKALTQMAPEEVIEEIKKSGLRGRGGAGFPTGLKWSFARKAAGEEKHVVCNGDEGDPGAYMNRTVLEGNPHAVIEGMAIGAYAIGNVRQGYAYVRAEYPLAIETLNKAINQAREYGLLGKNILGTGFDFDLDIFPGAGAFVCGEETALLASIEGKRGNPRQKPPFPANKGLFGRPTNINNVETWANVPLIIYKGVDWFRNVGSEKNPGTKTFCLVGKVVNTGLIEVPLSTPLGKIFFDIGGGAPNGKKFKAVQIGGPSGGCLPVEHLNVPIDYDGVPKLGAIMGSGGLIAMDEDNCMVNLAQFMLQFTKDESCGKCTPCRAGIPQMLEIITRIIEGNGKMEDLDTLEELAKMTKSASLCGLGQTAANPVLTTLQYFREEYEAHIIDKKCPAGVCQALFKAPCQHACPLEIDVPGYVALIKNNEFEKAYKLISQRTPLPSVCGMVCHAPCESKCRRGQLDEPTAIRDLKKFAVNWAHENGIEYNYPSKKANGIKVAIVGSGPAGLTAAHDLAREGYEVTIFEALPVAGGMLATCIPDYRLPKKTLEKEIEAIKKLGVKIILKTPVKDIESLLKEGYKAVFLAIGSSKGMTMGIPGEDLEGVFDAIDFLQEIHLGKRKTVGKRVAIIGGGNSAIDAARVAQRIGAERVDLFYRRDKADMTAIPEELEAAEEECIHFHCLTAPIKILGRDGKAVGLECIRMELREFDRSGRRKPYPIAGSEYVVKADMIIEAIGQRPDSKFLENKIDFGKGGTISVNNRTLETSMKGVFAGGDVATGPATVTEAMAAGRRAASSIRRYCKDEELLPRPERPAEETFTVPPNPPTEEELKEKPRVLPARIPTKRRITSFKEVIKPYTTKEATEEAKRCLRCDLEVSG